MEVLEQKKVETVRKLKRQNEESTTKRRRTSDHNQIMIHARSIYWHAAAIAYSTPHAPGSLDPDVDPDRFISFWYCIPVFCMIVRPHLPANLQNYPVPTPPPLLSLAGENKPNRKAAIQRRLSIIVLRVAQYTTTCYEYPPFVAFRVSRRHG